MKNLALNQPTTQTAQSDEGKSSKAVDGNTDSHFDAGSCSQTAEGDHDPWWAVDLGQLFTVQGVVFYNRKDCCGKFLLP